MDIKILCPCGAKYQFPVEPVDGRLPQRVSCPVCGADNTDLGNEAITVQLALNPSLERKLSLASPGGTSISGPEPEPAPPAASAGRLAAAARKSQGSAGSGKWKVLLGTLVALVLVAAGSWIIYTKVAKGIGKVTELVNAVSEINDVAEAASKVKWTLPDDDAAVLLVKNGNPTNVANALAATYGEVMRRPLQVLPATDEFDEHAAFIVYPAMSNSVEVSGPLNWPEPQATELAKGLTKRLSTVAVLALMGDDAETGVYAVFENGERKFWLKRSYQINQGNLQEFVERKGEDWAAQQGYVPDPTNILDSETDVWAFHDANALTLKLGIDVSQASEEVLTNILVLKSPQAAAR